MCVCVVFIPLCTSLETLDDCVLLMRFVGRSSYIDVGVSSELKKRDIIIVYIVLKTTDVNSGPLATVLHYKVGLYSVVIYRVLHYRVV